jgi:hypothetical protein
MNTYGNFIEHVETGSIYITKNPQYEERIIIKRVEARADGSTIVIYAPRMIDKNGNILLGLPFMEEIDLNVFHSIYKKCTRHAIEKMFNGQ